ncbi:tcp-1 cpn60 chaperonin family protein [Chrysochromulina tobinii]|jgi:T-complex protein 1 subunit zeta|uniref:Tcp-1 cpn60 chaperonin family protein n=1 Tax=Chrysochromulina tobinii TaxID=1460289 RepID=A0A0M0JZ06_9EUKA|nr:tcp-1 cpn60 chaperonin family protein [Chrysochromulina tobinii]|eukprot:KOO31537.1 tcp-1 cpn60 chaperonin family protein [Chrysochromulina sp. CCMP291]
MSAGAAARQVNPGAETLSKGMASMMNINAARGLQDVLKSNLGPKGTLKMLVSGSGDIKLTKDGNTLLNEMQIQHPTAMMIARIATAQDDITGDGTTSAVLIVGELMKQAERHLTDGVHPRLLTEGIEAAKEHILKYIDSSALKMDTTNRDLLVKIASASLRTKMHQELADLFTDIVVDAVLCIRKPNELGGFDVDLHMIETMHMMHKAGTDSRLVKGLVMDHGGRHPGMPKALKKCRVLTMNYDLEYQKSEVNSGFYYNSAEQRESMVRAERKWVDDRTQQILDLKKKACAPDETFVIINQKGIDPLALDMLAKEGILALRRAKRRNMERVTLACGGEQINSLEALSVECLGYCDSCEEIALPNTDDVYTILEGTRNPFSCSILVKGAHKHVIAQILEAVRDGTRSVANALKDGTLVPGAGGFETLAHAELMKFKSTISGRAKLGVQAYAEALLCIPKTLAENAGYDAQDSMLKLLEEAAKGSPKIGINIYTGEPQDPVAAGIFDNYTVKRQMLDSAAVIASQLLLVDEVIKAGRKMKKG